ncbi:MAG: (Fe-S)-binding protein [Magnetococcales bacterium]|nr:(Fe-S)-binding protein [Magnetococcales bacterium]
MSSPAAKKDAFAFIAPAEACTHCGYCLPVCPTYRADSNEVESPRGRVSILLALRDGHLGAKEAGAVLSHCLLCRACHAACPAGVKPGHLVSLSRKHHPLPANRLSRLFHAITDHAGRSRAAAWCLGLYRRSGLRRPLRALLRLFPALARLEGLVPDGPPAKVQTLPVPESGGWRIALIGSCMARLFYPATHPAAFNLLVRLGHRPVSLVQFGCCGAPHRERGDWPALQRQATLLMRQLEGNGPFDAIVADSDLCASTLKAYGHIFGKHNASAGPAERMAKQVYTLSQFLAEAENWSDLPKADPGLGRLAFHDHCQTRHGSGIINEPRSVLATLPVALGDIPDGAFCCGAGGEYLLRHPERSRGVRELKIAAIRASGADTVVGANPGCLLNIEAGLREEGVRVMPLAEVLWRAIR